jgi:hypothetical protein
MGVYIYVYRANNMRLDHRAVWAAANYPAGGAEVSTGIPAPDTWHGGTGPESPYFWPWMPPL